MATTNLVLGRHLTHPRARMHYYYHNVLSRQTGNSKRISTFPTKIHVPDRSGFVGINFSATGQRPQPSRVAKIQYTPLYLD